MMKRTILLCGLLFSLAFAGCVDEGADDDPALDTDQGTDGTGMAPADEALNADSLVDAPEWEVGDYFGHHIFFGSEDSEGTHIDTVVREDQGSEWILATDNEEAAKWEAAWDFPMLGAIAKDDLSTTAFATDWNLYDFPLTDGKTWTAEFDPLFNGPRELTLTATFDPAIPTIGQGKKAGFVIEGVNEDGAVELMTDYIPEIGWYSGLDFIDRTTYPEASDDEFVIRIYGMGQGEAWEGTLIDAEAEEKVNFSTCFAPLNQDGTVNDGCLAAGVASQFTVNEDADELYGAYFLLAIAGHSRLDVVELGDQPFSHDNEVMSQGIDSVEAEFGFYEIDDPTPGDWVSKWDGEGFVTVGYNQLWEIRFNEAAFPA